jgi:hypothetical protein
MVDNLSYVNSTSNTGAPPHRSSASGSITPNPMLLAGLDAVHRPCHQVGFVVHDLEEEPRAGLIAQNHRLNGID